MLAPGNRNGQSAQTQCVYAGPRWTRLGLGCVLGLAPSVLGGHRHGEGDLDLCMCLASPLLAWGTPSWGRGLVLGMCLASPLLCLGDTAMGEGTWTCVCAWPRPFCAWGTPSWGRGLGLGYVLGLAPSVLGRHRHEGGDLDMCLASPPLCLEWEWNGQSAWDLYLGMCLASPLLRLRDTAMGEGTCTCVCAWSSPFCAWGERVVMDQENHYKIVITNYGCLPAALECSEEISQSTTALPCLPVIWGVEVLK